MKNNKKIAIMNERFCAIFVLLRMREEAPERPIFTLIHSTYTHTHIVLHKSKQEEENDVYIHHVEYSLQVT